MNTFLDFCDDRVALLVKRFKPVLLSASVAIYEIEPQWTMLKDKVYSK